MNKMPLAKTSMDANQYGSRILVGIWYDTAKNVIPDKINRKPTRISVLFTWKSHSISISKLRMILLANEM